MKKTITLFFITILTLSNLVARSQNQVEPDGMGCSSSSSLSKIGNNFFYFGKNETNPANYDLFMHNGTTGTAGTSILTLGASSVNPTSYQIHEAYGKGFFTFNLNGGNSPWVTDGTAAGTFTLSNTTNGAAWFVNAAGKVFFPSFSQAVGTELWMTDGTVAGTQLVKDMRFGGSSSFPTEGVLFNNEVWFQAAIINNTTKYLCHSNGTTAGTTSLTLPSGISGSIVGKLTVLNNYLYFMIGSNTYKTDGTTAGTSLVATGMTTFTSFNNMLLATGYGSLYVIDPITQDTNLIQSNTTITATETGNWMLNNKLIFMARTLATGSEPYVTDGTAAGTSLLANITLNSYSTTVQPNAAYLNNELYFSTQVGVWKTNGTPAGTYSTGITLATNELNSLYNLNNDVYFLQTSAAIPANKKLWRLSATPTGINEADESKDYLVYPNPSNGMVTVRSQKPMSTINVFNLTGDLIYTNTVNDIEITIDLINQSKGIYFYQVSDLNHTLKTGKIIVQ